MNLDDLTAVLSEYPTSVRPLDPPEALGNAGGLSGARLWRFTSGLGRVLARAWPEDGPDRAALERIHGWLGTTAEALDFIPMPVPGLDGRTVRTRGGRLWSVEPWMPGQADPTRPPDPARLRAGFAALAAFHLRLPRDRVVAPSPGLSARLHEVDGLMGDEFAALKSAVLRASGQADCDAGPVIAWFSAFTQAAPWLVVPLRHATTVAVPLQPVLRDARPEHILFEGERVSGLVDFGAMGVDSVAADLARLLLEWVEDDPDAHAEVLAAYTALRPLSESEWALIEVFENSAALLGASHWLRWHFVEGRRFDDPWAVGNGVRKGFERLSRLMERRFRPFTR